MKFIAAVLVLSQALLSADDALTIERRYRNLVHHLQAAGPSVALSDASNALSAIYFERGDYALAETLSRVALDAEQHCASPRPIELARRLANVGAALTAQRRPAGAAVFVKQALAIFEQHDAPIEKAYALNTLGDIALRSYDPATAAIHFERVLTLWRGRPAEYAQGLANLAVAQIELGQTNAALKSWDQAVECARTALPPGRIRAAILLGYADALKRTGRMSQSRFAQALASAMLDSSPTLAGRTVDLGDFRRLSLSDGTEVEGSMPKAEVDTSSTSAKTSSKFVRNTRGKLCHRRT